MNYADAVKNYNKAKKDLEIARKGALDIIAERIKKETNTVQDRDHHIVNGSANMWFKNEQTGLAFWIELDDDTFELLDFDSYGDIDIEMSYTELRELIER